MKQGLAKSQLGSCVMQLVATLMSASLGTGDWAGCCHESVAQLAQLQQFMNSGQQHTLVNNLKEDEEKSIPVSIRREALV